MIYHKFRKYKSYNNKVSKYQKSYGLRDNTENEVISIGLLIIEAKMHENEATTHEAENEANNCEAENEVKAVKFRLEADPSSRTSLMFCSLATNFWLPAVVVMFR